MKVYTKEQVLLLVRKELELANKALNIETVFGGLTNADLQTLGIIACALHDNKKTHRLTHSNPNS